MDPGDALRVIRALVANPSLVSAVRAMSTTEEEDTVAVALGTRPPTSLSADEASSFRATLEYQQEQLAAMSSDRPPLDSRIHNVLRSGVPPPVE